MKVSLSEHFKILEAVIFAFTVCRNGVLANFLFERSKTCTVSSCIQSNHLSIAPQICGGLDTLLAPCSTRCILQMPQSDWFLLWWWSPFASSLYGLFHIFSFVMCSSRLTAFCTVPDFGLHIIWISQDLVARERQPTIYRSFESLTAIFCIDIPYPPWLLSQSVAETLFSKLDIDLSFYISCLIVWT